MSAEWTVPIPLFFCQCRWGFSRGLDSALEAEDVVRMRRLFDQWLQNEGFVLPETYVKARGVILGEESGPILCSGHSGMSRWPSWPLVGMRKAEIKENFLVMSGYIYF